MGDKASQWHPQQLQFAVIQVPSGTEPGQQLQGGVAVPFQLLPLNLGGMHLPQPFLQVQHVPASPSSSSVPLASSVQLSPGPQAVYVHRAGEGLSMPLLQSPGLSQAPSASSGGLLQLVRAASGLQQSPSPVGGGPYRFLPPQGALDLSDSAAFQTKPIVRTSVNGTSTHTPGHVSVTQLPDFKATKVRKSSDTKGKDNDEPPSSHSTRNKVVEVIVLEDADSAEQIVPDEAPKTTEVLEAQQECPACESSAHINRMQRLKHRNVWKLKRKFTDISSRLELMVCEAKNLINWKSSPRPAKVPRLTDEDLQLVACNHKRRQADICSKQCLTVLKSLMQHKFAWPFNQPVDILKYADYLNFVKEPMDFGTIKAKLESGGYADPADVNSDVTLVFNNARAYNPAGSDVFFMAQTLQEAFTEKWMRLVVPRIQEDAKTRLQDEQAVAARRAEQQEAEDQLHIQQRVQTLLTYISGLQNDLKQLKSQAALLCEPLTEEELQQLARDLSELKTSELEGALALLMAHGNLLFQEDGPTKEEGQHLVDLSKYSCLELRQLQHYVKTCKTRLQSVSAPPDSATSKPPDIVHTTPEQAGPEEVGKPEAPTPMSVDPAADPVDNVPGSNPDRKEVTPPQPQETAALRGQQHQVGSPNSQGYCFKEVTLDTSWRDTQGVVSARAGVRWPGLLMGSGARAQARSLIFPPAGAEVDPYWTVVPKPSPSSNIKRSRNGPTHASASSPPDAVVRTPSGVPLAAPPAGGTFHDPAPSSAPAGPNAHTMAPEPLTARNLNIWDTPFASSSNFPLTPASDGGQQRASTPQPSFGVTKDLRVPLPPVLQSVPQPGLSAAIPGDKSPPTGASVLPNKLPASSAPGKLALGPQVPPDKPPRTLQDKPVPAPPDPPDKPSTSAPVERGPPKPDSPGPFRPHQGSGGVPPGLPLVASSPSPPLLARSPTPVAAFQPGPTRTPSGSSPVPVLTTMLAPTSLPQGALPVTIPMLTPILVPANNYLQGVWAGGQGGVLAEPSLLCQTLVPLSPQVTGAKKGHLEGVPRFSQTSSLVSSNVSRPMVVLDLNQPPTTPLQQILPLAAVEKLTSPALVNQAIGSQGRNSQDPAAPRLPSGVPFQVSILPPPPGTGANSSTRGAVQQPQPIFVAVPSPQTIVRGGGGPSSQTASFALPAMQLQLPSGSQVPTCVPMLVTGLQPTNSKGVGSLPMPLHLIDTSRILADLKDQPPADVRPLSALHGDQPLKALMEMMLQTSSSTSGAQDGPFPLRTYLPESEQQALGEKLAALVSATRESDLNPTDNPSTTGATAMKGEGTGGAKPG